MKNVLCDYCGKPTRFVDDSIVYGRQQSLPCGAGLRPARANPADSSPALLKPARMCNGLSA